MAVAVLMPKAGITVETCLIGAWNKKVGDRVAAGDILFNYETDKAAFECESTADGTLLEIFCGDGEEAPVLTPVCAVGEPGESVDHLRAAGGGAAAATPQPANDNIGGAGINATAAADAAAAANAADAAAPGTAAPGCAGLAAPQPPAAISPRARSLASRFGVDARNAVPTGPHGRVIERDIEMLINNPQAADFTAAQAANFAAAQAAQPQYPFRARRRPPRPALPPRNPPGRPRLRRGRAANARRIPMKNCRKYGAQSPTRCKNRLRTPRKSRTTIRLTPQAYWR